MAARWSQLVRKATLAKIAHDMPKARELLHLAVKTRCPFYVADDQQCTADATPPHEHRNDEGDMA